MEQVILEACGSGIRLAYMRQHQSAPETVAVVFNDAQLAAARIWANTGSWSAPRVQTAPITIDAGGEGIRVLQVVTVGRNQESRAVVLKGNQVSAFRDWLRQKSPPTPAVLEA